MCFIHASTTFSVYVAMWELILLQYQTGNLTVENATITRLSLIPATGAVPPPNPVIPINYSNSSVQEPQPLPLVNLSVVVDNETGSVTYSIPTNIKMIIQPSAVVSFDRFSISHTF